MPVNLAGGWGWAIVLGLLLFIPVLDFVAKGVGMPWLGPVLEGLIIGFLLWNVYCYIRGQRGQLPVGEKRVWSPDPVALLGIGLLALALWDPLGWVPWGANFLAGGGFLEGALARFARGVLTVVGVYVVYTNLRKTEGSVARRQTQALTKARKADQKAEKRAAKSAGKVVARPPRQ